MNEESRIKNGSVKKPNIILITFDDCRADHLGFMGYGRDTSPFLDSLAGKSVYFKKAFATGSGSPQSFVGTMTSTYPLDYGGFSYIDRPRVLVSEVLKKAGYETAAVHSAPYMSGYFGYDRGWDTFRYLSPFKTGGTSAGNRKETTRAKILDRIYRARRWLKNSTPFLAPIFSGAVKLIFLFRKLILEAVEYTPPFLTGDKINEEVKKIFPQRPAKPLFLWVHFIDIHEPLGFFWRNGRGLVRKLKFHLADIVLFLFGGNSRISKTFRNLFVELYDASVRSSDEHIMELFEYLKSKEIINDESLTVICSDHGSEFFEKGEFGHGQRPFNANLNVPLLFYSPKNLKPRAENDPVSLIDVSPTILDFVSVAKPPVYKGKSIFDGARREVVAQMIDCRGDLTNRKFLGAVIINRGYKFISFRGEKMLFALGDKNEENNLYDAERKTADELEKNLKKYIA